MQATSTTIPRSTSQSFREARNQSIIRQRVATEADSDFVRAACEGLKSEPPKLPSRFLYDARGSLLFEMITRQPEYYLTRIESSILAASAARIRNMTGPATLVELGSGNSQKTDYLLGAWLSRDKTATYVPVDVSESALRRASGAICQRHPAVHVVGLHGDYHEAFPLLKDASPVVVFFLGSSIGNFEGRDMDVFLAELYSSLTPGDFFLAGFDLVKDPDIINAAYNDAAGVTQEFTRNLFVRMNRELGSTIDPAAVIHEARYSVEREQVEIDARFTRDQEIVVAPAGRRFHVSAGRRIRTEISRKFRLESLLPYVESFGFTTREVFTDPLEWFALVLLEKPGSGKRLNRDH